jgi:uncharacterized integral membrane protein
MAEDDQNAGYRETGVTPAASDADSVQREGGGGHHVTPVPRRTRLGGMWMALVSGAVVLVLLLVFILQNSQRIEVHLYGAHWNAPVGVALLMAAALGLLLVVIPGAGRILQLRRAAHRAHERVVALQRAQPGLPPDSAPPPASPSPRL